MSNSGRAEGLGAVSDSPPATASDSLDRGDERYTYERELGRGAMGAVFLVRDRETGERLALKKLYRMDGKAALRVKREFRLLADLSHANLVKLYELARARDGWFLTMEYVQGEELTSYVKRERDDKAPHRLGAATSAALAQGTALHLRLLPVFYQLACGVHALHRAGMLHRDLKPSNVLVANHRVVVLDFGLRARVRTRSGIVRAVPRARRALGVRGVRIRLLLNHHITEGTVALVAPRLDAELRACSALRPKAIATGITLALRARLAHAQGKSEAAIALLRAALLKLRATDRAGDVARTSHALGCLVGGDEGKALCRSSTSFLQANGVPDPLGYLHGYWPELREKASVQRTCAIAARLRSRGECCLPERGGV